MRRSEPYVTLAQNDTKWLPLILTKFEARVSEMLKIRQTLSKSELFFKLYGYG